jgi:hypothetical protein
MEAAEGVSSKCFGGEGSSSSPRSDDITFLLFGVKGSGVNFGFFVSGTIIRGTLKAPNSQLVTPISIKLQRPDGHD